MLVPENRPAGKVNGKRFAARPPFHSEPGSASFIGIVVKYEARRGRGGGERRASTECQIARQALRLLPPLREASTCEFHQATPLF